MLETSIINIKTFSQIVTLHSIIKEHNRSQPHRCPSGFPANPMSLLLSIFRVGVRLLLAALFLCAGTIHLRDPGLFLPVMPPWIPFPLFCILISGGCELLGGGGLLIPVRPIQFVTGWGLTLLLVAVFPANIYMAVAHVQVHGFPSHAWMAWVRLLLQPLLIVAVLWVTRIWPGKCK
jgi:uncharacterized membrane protein